jgi:Ricin-type beta-trefoil lectin domain-like
LWIAAGFVFFRPLFYIVSEMNCKVLDIQGGSPVSGARVIMWPKKSGRPSNQLWYFDSQGVIRSALNDFVMEAQSKLSTPV